MSSLRSFKAVLADGIDLDAHDWEFSVTRLPQATQTNANQLVKSLSFISNEKQQEIVLRYEKVPSNRVTREAPLDRFLLISLANFRLRWPATTPGEPSKTATGRENGDYMTRLLKTGVKLNGVRYHFFGHSNSQLKSRSCFMYSASKEELSRKIEAMGDLSKLKSVAKKVKRIGLLFSSAEMALELRPERCKDIEDVKQDDYIFTDGCGSISPHLARHLVQRRNIVFRNKRYLPSVFQIRYRGYKGVLTLDPSLHGQVQVEFRESMRKFKDAPDHSLAVVDYSKPYSFGYLNDEVVVLLSALGVSEQTLLSKQSQHLEFLRRASQGDARAAFQFLSYSDKIDLAEKLLLNGFEAVRSTVTALVRQEYTKMLNKKDEQRCRILIPKSRLLFGVCDPTSKNGRPGILKEGQCFVRITEDGDGMARTIINTEVMVTRNPCLHPGDLQKFKAVDIPEFANHLVDCIVFSTRGKRPSADLMSGGDLDGDKFFVTWDPEIIPRTMSEPAQYPGGKELISFGEVTGDSRAEYFARYTSASLGQVKNLYMKWARLGNAMSPECQQLNRLFSQCVDGNRIRIPENLKIYKTLEDPKSNETTIDDTGGSSFILDVLHDASTNFIRQTVFRPDSSDDMEVMELFLARDKIAISEFELLKLIWKWCQQHDTDILELSHLINFSALTDEQQIWVLGGLPPSIATPGLIRNGLLQSDVVSPEELRRFRLDHSALHWKPVFKSSDDRMGRFLPVVSQTLETFHKKLIVLKVDERLTFAIYVPTKIAKASEVQVDTAVRVFALPHSQGTHSPAYKVLPTKVNYRIYSDEHVFQLYQEKRGNTWIFLRRPQNDDSMYRTEKSKGDKRRMRDQTVQEGINHECKASIALDKVSRDIQKHVGRVQQNSVLDAEIYVISNRDVNSMRVLDQWLNYIDTEEVLPLFDKLDIEYEILKLESVNWASYSAKVVAVVRDQNLSSLRLVESAAELRIMFDLLNSHNEKKKLRDIYSYVLDLEASSSSALDNDLIASALLDYLTQAVYLVPTYLRSQTWNNHKPTLEADFSHIALTLLRSLILLINEMGSFVYESITLVLQEMDRISIQSFCELVELSALVVRSPEEALDLFLEVLDPQVPRLLIGRPMAIRQLVSSLFGIALDHIDEASNAGKPARETIKLDAASDRNGKGRKGGKTHKDGYTLVTSTLRIDSTVSSSFKIGDHVRLTVMNSPSNSPIAKPLSIDAMVVSAETGEVTFGCLHQLPSYFEQCGWSVVHCGSFVTNKTSLDALTDFYATREVCCRIYASLLGLPTSEQIALPNVGLPVAALPELNASQNGALIASMKNSLTFIWGPPGTGKTQTIVKIMSQLLKALPESRFLVTAPTHNACDNLMKRFLRDSSTAKGDVPIRVSTQFSKVDPDLRNYTCDAMLGKDLSTNMSARRQAQKRIKEARLVFTTCIGAGLGLLRDENFDVVIVDEASQLTEPATLVPLVKGCSRAILVGDHVQLRATVQQNALLTGYDISLFERHYKLLSREGVAKVMLDTQYRMHRSICGFSSSEFYEGKLRTAVPDVDRPLQPSLFPWPEKNRMVWIDCDADEDLGHPSKSNAGQVTLCREVVRLITTSPNRVSKINASIVILTPYTRQKTLLTSAIPNTEVSSIDGFQGREADIIIFVSVRCNAHGDLGFLTDMRRLNVVMTRAKAGVVVIGNKRTLAENTNKGNIDESRLVWQRLIGKCSAVTLPLDIDRVD